MSTAAKSHGAPGGSVAVHRGRGVASIISCVCDRSSKKSHRACRSHRGSFVATSEDPPQEDDMKKVNACIAICSFVTACGATPDGAPSDVSQKSYAEMTFEERALFMNDTVLPRMRETFVAFEAKFANMSCGTCHGEGVTSGA